MMEVSDHFAFFDGDCGSAVLLLDYRRTICFDASDPLSDDLASVFEKIEAASASGEWVSLAADYGLGATLDSAMALSTLECPKLRAWVFGRAQHLDAKAADEFLAERFEFIPEGARVSGVAALCASQDAESYLEKVDKVRQWIAEGDCYQINLTFSLGFKVYGHPLALYTGLRLRQPVRYGACILTPEEAVLSFSPELFFERNGGRVVTRPMKGTAPRGATQEDDDARRSSLLASEKERAENIMIVDLLRNDLGRLAAPGDVRVDVLCGAEAYPTLWQMVSTVSADLPTVSVFELFRALFPCGSITGAPKIRAMKRIAELEGEPRGLYTGALGWLAPSGNSRFNVAIRTLEIDSRGNGRLGVGSGIVIDADPEREYAECLLKARFLTGYDPGFKLIETMRLESGKYRLLALHLERLSASALALGFACDLSSISDALNENALSCGEGFYRVRVNVSHDGTYCITCDPMSLDNRQWQVAVSDDVLNSDDYLLRHKTSARSRYDRALACLSDTPEVFDTIFFNEKGEVCEGARSSVFVARDDVLLTPPLSCGLLPGVMRRHLIESGRAVERVLYREDLLSASRIYLANALRGLIPVRLRKNHVHHPRTVTTIFR